MLLRYHGTLENKNQRENDLKLTRNTFNCWFMLANLNTNILTGLKNSIVNPLKCAFAHAKTGFCHRMKRFRIDCPRNFKF